MTYTNFDVKCAVAHGEDLIRQKDILRKPLEYDDYHIAILCSEYRKSHRLSAIAGKIIALVITAAILVFASAGLICALNLLGRVIWG
jgi:hypothetical protein